MKGTAYNVDTGERLGSTDDLEGTFLEAVKDAAAVERVYVVDGGATSFDLMREVVAIGVPVVRDTAIGDRAIIVAGAPEEWPELLAELLRAE